MCAHIAVVICLFARPIAAYQREKCAAYKLFIFADWFSFPLLATPVLLSLSSLLTQTSFSKKLCTSLLFLLNFYWALSANVCMCVCVYKIINKKRTAVHCVGVVLCSAHGTSQMSCLFFNVCGIMFGTLMTVARDFSINKNSGGHP